MTAAAGTAAALMSVLLWFWLGLSAGWPDLWVILGGGLAARDPEILHAVDADAVALDVHDGAEKLAAHLAEINHLARTRAVGQPG